MNNDFKKITVDFWIKVYCSAISSGRNTDQATLIANESIENLTEFKAAIKEAERQYNQPSRGLD